jgi:hypothetical protein
LKRQAVLPPTPKDLKRAAFPDYRGGRDSHIQMLDLVDNGQRPAVDLLNPGNFL